jgi:hypothetical protein
VIRALRRAGTALALGVLVALPAKPCELVLTEHRSGRLLLQLPLNPAQPVMQLAFVHSVLQTPVIDIYRWRADETGHWQAWLEQEIFEGEGYGLPHAPATAERLLRHDRGWRLELSRKVDPLVVRPLPAQQMRLVRSGWPDLQLGSLSNQAIAMQARDCPPTQ